MADDHRLQDFKAQARELVLIRIIRRLEAATSRLEDIASAAQPHGGPHPPVAAISEGPSTNGTAAETTPLSPSAVTQPAAVLAFDSLIEDDLKSFAKLSEQLGGLVAEQVSVECRRWPGLEDISNRTHRVLRSTSHSRLSVKFS